MTTGKGDMIQPPERVTDAQVHLITPPSESRPWPSNVHSYAHPVESLTAERLVSEMDRVGVDRAVLVPPSFEGDRNDVCLDAAASFPDRFAVMGRISLTDPASLHLLDGWAEIPGMRGVRVTFSQGESRSWLDDGTADWFWGAAESRGLPVMIFAPGRGDAIASIAAGHPGLRLIVDHVGIPTDKRDSEIDPYIEDVLSLHQHSNIAVKLSSLPAFVTEHYPFPSLRQRVLRVVETFGPERCAWGSDLTRLRCTYEESLEFLLEVTSEMTSREVGDLLDGTISRWLRWL